MAGARKTGPLGARKKRLFVFKITNHAPLSCGGRSEKKLTFLLPRLGRPFITILNPPSPPRAREKLCEKNTIGDSEVHELLVCACRNAQTTVRYTNLPLNPKMDNPNS